MMGRITLSHSVFINALVSFLIVFATVDLEAQTHRIDLKKWGYKSRPVRTQVFQEFSPVVSVALDGKVAVAFVTRDRTGLVTRDLPAFALHVLRFTSTGEFMDERVVPTSTWNQNAIFFTSTGGLLVKAGSKLELFSSQMKPIAEKETTPTKDSPLVSWRIFPNRDQTAFLAYNFRRESTSIELLSADDLHSLEHCLYDPHDRLLAFSDDVMLSFLPTLSSDPLGREIEVKRLCARDVEYTYRWHGDPVSATLVRGHDVLLAGGGPEVRFLTAGASEPLWKITFGRHDSVSDHVEVSKTGMTIALTVKTLVGGNQFFDVPSHLNSERIVVLRSANGNKVKEITIESKAPSVFGFALSPDGKTLAIAADSSLEIHSIAGSE